MKNLKLSRRDYCIGKLVLSNHMETSGEKANSDLFVHEVECSDQVICLQNMYWSIPLSLEKYRDRSKIICWLHCNAALNACR